MVHREMFRKRPKITMLSSAYDDADLEAKVNEFIRNRDIEDIQYSACHHHYGPGITVKQAFIFYYE